jgi:carboxymethylenebutenolidase
MGETLTIHVADGDFNAYVARPDTDAASPVVVVLHEVFGVNADMRATCKELASRGFIAVCPDLFWRQTPRVDLSVTSEADWNAGLALYLAFDRKAGVDDVIAAVRAAARMKGATGKAAVLGYCLGGLMAFLTAARSPVDAAVAYHGGDTDRYLDEAGAITAPFLMHLAADDEFITKEAQSRIRSALAGKDNVEIYSYPGCNHAFSRREGLHYDPAAAIAANARTWAFLADHLA